MPEFDFEAIESADLVDCEFWGYEQQGESIISYDCDSDGVEICLVLEVLTTYYCVGYPDESLNFSTV